MKFILLIYVKMPTIVGIFTFISMINAPSGGFEIRIFFIFQHFSFYEQFQSYMFNWVERKKKSFITLGPGLPSLIIMMKRN